MRPIQNMTAAEIRNRLAALADEQSRHEARDFDGELAATLRSGGDVDALEQAQLEAERRTRRLRVERVALEAELPIALEREGKAAVAELARQHLNLAPLAAGARDQLEKTWAEYLAAVTAWGALQHQAALITDQATSVASQSKTPLPADFGHFQSHRVDELLDDFHRQQEFVLPRLATAQHSTLTHSGLRSVRLD